MVTDKVVHGDLPAGVQAITTRHTTVREGRTDQRASSIHNSLSTRRTIPDGRATVDGAPVTITPAGDLGHMTVPVPAGEHTVALWFADTLPRTAGTILSLLAAVAGVGYGETTMSKARRWDVGWLAALLLCVFAIAPLSAPGFFLKGHDATIGSYFLWQFDQAIADGALYPRWAMDWTFGYGYPVFIVIAPLAFYVAEAAHLLGAGLVDALKIAYALSIVFSGLSMYLLGRELFGRAGGLLAAGIYVYAPYHLVDIYVRADLAEFAAFAFFPAILWAIVRLNRARVRGETLRYVALGALFYGGLILTHITMAMIFTPVALLFAVATVGSREQGVGSREQGVGSREQGAGSREQGAGSREQRAGSREQETATIASPRLRVSASPLPPVSASPRLRVFVAQIALFALGAAIGAAYLFPGFLEQRYLRAQDLVGGYFGYANHYVYPFQLLSPLWDYGYAAIGAGDQMPFQLGAVALVLALCAVWALPRMRSDTRRQVVFFLAMTGLIVFAMLSASQPLWDMVRPLVAFVQFPWRLLSLTALTLALLGGSLLAAGNEEADGEMRQGAQQAGSKREQQAAPLLLLVLLASYAYAVPQYTDSALSLAKMIQFQLDTKELLGDTIWVTEKPTGSPMVAEYLAGRPPTRAIPDDPATQIDVLHSGGASYEVRVSAPAPSAILFQIRYFPGWSAYVDGNPVATTIRPPQALMAVAVPQGTHTVLLRFEDTRLRLASKLLSLAGLIVAGVLLVRRRRLSTDEGTEGTEGVHG